MSIQQCEACDFMQVDQQEATCMRCQVRRLRDVLSDIGDMRGGMADQAPWYARDAICTHEKMIQYNSGARDAKTVTLCEYCRKTPEQIASAQRSSTEKMEP